jgi:hypothetical protein
VLVGFALRWQWTSHAIFQAAAFPALISALAMLTLAPAMRRSGRPGLGRLGSVL